MSTSTRQRRERILNQVYEAGHVAVRDLALSMSISEATVRRDLRTLADAKAIQLVHGGAAPVRAYDFSFSTKMTRNLDAKKVIGRLAAESVSDDDTIFLDSGTTCCQMVPFLKRKRGLKIIVNSARLAVELDTPGLDVILIGGQYRPERMDTVGPLATGMLEQLRGYVAFIGADGMSVDFGLTASDIESAHLYRMATRNAREVVLVADNSKFASPSLFKIVDFDVISRVVTDGPLPAEWNDFFAGRGIEVTLPAQTTADGPREKADLAPQPGTFSSRSRAAE